MCSRDTYPGVILTFTLYSLLCCHSHPDTCTLYVPAASYTTSPLPLTRSSRRRAPYLNSSGAHTTTLNSLHDAKLGLDAKMLPSFRVATTSARPRRGGHWATMVMMVPVVLDTALPSYSIFTTYPWFSGGSSPHDVALY
ncbi:hypothetical protein E2C01_056603 [Portunus trituberculatus]|uniref:Uncharacterized protein n=1 Tax=Portunus trituberculatus TaxID=210409 RepID=A0A5B7H013_PORTR|nr:hypothetical protein [Portunus trituberculatus]